MRTLLGEKSSSSVQPVKLHVILEYSSYSSCFQLYQQIANFLFCFLEKSVVLKNVVPLNGSNNNERPIQDGSLFCGMLLWPSAIISFIFDCQVMSVVPLFAFCSMEDDFYTAHCAEVYDIVYKNRQRETSAYSTDIDSLCARCVLNLNSEIIVISSRIIFVFFNCRKILEAIS